MMFHAREQDRQMAAKRAKRKAAEAERAALPIGPALSAGPGEEMGQGDGQQLQPQRLYRAPEVRRDRQELDQQQGRAGQDVKGGGRRDGQPDRAGDPQRSHRQPG